jgi:hypothetical protein
MSIVTPERWYQLFWIGVGIVGLLANAWLTRWAVLSALEAVKR